MAIEKRLTAKGRKAEKEGRRPPPSEVRYTVRVLMGRDPKTGRRSFMTATCDTKKAAEKQEREWEKLKDQGALKKPSKEPLEDYLQSWLDDVKEGQVRARTLADYRANVRRYIQEPPRALPRIGKIRMHELTGNAFQSLYAAMRKDLGLAPRTIQYLHSILRQALDHAVVTGAVPANRTDGVKPPTRKRDEEGVTRTGKTHRAMSEEEAGRFLEAAREDRYFALWTLLLTGGLRPGEAFGLAWEAVDLDEGRVHVERALTRRGVEGWALVPPKTDRGRRSVALPPMTVRALREWRRTQAEERLLLGAEYEDNGFVFANEFGKPLDGGNLYNRNFRRIMAAAGLGEWEGEGRRRKFKPAYRVYDLRHTCATLLLKRGINPKIVQERLGHASITLTLDTYSHVLPDMQEGAADELEAMLGAGG